MFDLPLPAEIVVVFSGRGLWVAELKVKPAFRGVMSAADAGPERVARTCSLGPRLFAVVGGRTADLLEQVCATTLGPVMAGLVIPL